MPLLIDQFPVQAVSRKYAREQDSGRTSFVQESQQLKKKLQNQEEELRCAHRSGKDLQSQLMLQTQTGHAAHRDATQLKVSLYTQDVQYCCLCYL